MIVNSLSGYWPKDYYQLNPNFGTADDLKNLVKALHDRDMYLMVDLVVNHYASWGDEVIQWSQYVPFNDQQYFHNNIPARHVPKQLTETRKTLLRLLENPEAFRDHIRLYVTERILYNLVTKLP